MITTLLSFEIVIFTLWVHFQAIMPNWCHPIICIVWFIVHMSAYISEDNLRDRIGQLEDEIKKLKKGDKV